MSAEPVPARRGGFPAPAAATARMSRSVALPEYLPARMLNEFVYCPRLFFYEWVEGVFAHSVDTVEGALRHEKLETKHDALPGAEPGEKIHARSVQLSSELHRLIAVIDLVEGDGERVTPVDYKRGAPRDGAEGPEAWDADRAQVCAQALILRDNGYHCDEAVLYYNATKQRVRVAINEALVAETLEAIAASRRTAEAHRIPPPLIDSPKCPRCSLVSICLPDETMFAMSIHEGDDGDEQLALFPDEPSGEAPPGAGDARAVEPRRLVPARDDLRPLYVTGYGMTIGKSGDVLQVREKKALVKEARLNEVSQVNVFGNISVTAPAVQGLCAAEKPIAYFSSGGWFYGLTQGLGLRNVFLRRDQFRRADDPVFCVRVAREIVATKIRNQRTLIQRNHVEPPARTLQILKQLASAAQRAEELDVLLGVEGAAARTYFEQLSGMLKPDDEETAPAFDFTHRNRRPPHDPVNALLSMAYSLLVRDLTTICHSIGFDPFIGFYHQPRFGRPALALDLMEGFRPILADSAVLTVVNTGMVDASDFVHVGPAVSLSPSGRKALIRAYEQRMDNLVTHPLFGYRVSYRRVLEIQARLLARVVTGELAKYPGFETR
ncbi:MAG TPA: CRISPR-associated endonuclease Cas1 [Vicinamibacterales bacterium]|nr:CRISPR-associated endonuclease Cas1 [Vicinamibacterales bacterium]